MREESRSRGLCRQLNREACWTWVEHPNRRRYPGQLIYVVEIEGYVHLVPFVADAEGMRFLKTIIPSRKATRDYLRRRQS